eukprot:2330666-Pyramimonas_sp.AAC.1
MSEVWECFLLSCNCAPTPPVGGHARPNPIGPPRVARRDRGGRRCTMSGLRGPSLRPRSRQDTARDEKLVRGEGAQTSGGRRCEKLT